MFKPSFYGLYKQGRFRTPGSEGTKEAKRQVERFAVATLAFALQHQVEFRKDFLKRVCQRNRGDDAEQFKLELEVAGCGDFVVRKKDHSEAYAFEFKVESPLQSHQDPRDPEFFASGYGHGIRQQPWVKSTYILIQNEPLDLNNVTESVPNCRGDSWRSISKCSYETLLITDLFESFGSLGIPAFIHMNTKNISLGHGDSTLDAVKLYQLLHAVAGSIGSKPKFEVDFGEDKKGGYIGMNFVPTAKSNEWQRLVQADDDVIGWFGYSQDKKTNRSTLDVWFYCGKRSAAAAAKIRSQLPKNFRQPKLPPEVKNRPEEKNYVWISLPAKDSADNQEWFISVFDSLIERK